jgi:hypothetical protein
MYIKTELIECLAKLPQLRRLHFRGGRMDQQWGFLWGQLRSLQELQLGNVLGASRVVPTLRFMRTLRLLRWYCHTPQLVPSSPNHVGCLPLLEPLREQMTAVKQLRVELMVSSSFYNGRPSAHWDQDIDVLKDHVQHLWTDLRLLPSQLPRTRIVEFNDETQ